MDISLGSKKPKGRFELDADVPVETGDLSLGPRTKTSTTSNLPSATGPVDDLDAFMNPHKERAAADVPPPQKTGTMPDFGEEGDVDAEGMDYDDYEDAGYEGEFGDAYEEPTEKPSKGYANVEDEKVDLLTQIARYEAKGNGVKKLDMRSDIQDVRVEYRRIQEELGIQASLKFSRRALMACVTGMEYLNHRYDPFKIKLDGWSEQTYESIDDYDNVFEKLHRKWASKVEVAPEIELLMMVGSGAFMFHLTQSFFNSGGAGASIGGNPSLMKEIMKTMAQTQQKQPSVPGMNPPTQPPRPSSGPEPTAQGGNDMPGPSIDLSAFPMPPQMSTGFGGNAEEKLKSLREELPPNPTSAPPPKAVDTRKQDSVFEDDLGDLDSLAGSDLDIPDPEPVSEPEKPKKKTAPKKRTTKTKTIASGENTVEI